MTNEIKMVPRLVDGLCPRPGHRVEGLRPQTGTDGQLTLVAAGMPRLLAGSSGWTPLGRTAWRRVAASQDRALAVIDGAHATGGPSVQAARLSGTALCSHRLGDGRLLVMTQAGADIVSDDGVSLQVSAAVADYPAICLRAESGNVATATVPERTLSKGYGSNRRLSAADRAAIASDLEEAYRAVCADACGAGYLVQPVLARYRLLDHSGGVLFESPTVLLMPPEGIQCADSVSVSSADGQTVSAYTLQVKLWRPAVEIPAAASFADSVAAVEILTSPQFHPYHPDGIASVDSTRTQSGVFARVGLPGAHRTIAGVNDAAASAYMARAIARMELLERRMCHVSRPFGSEAYVLRPAVPSAADPGEDARAFDAALRRKVAAPSWRQALLSAPHTFSAGCTATDGVSVAWGCLRAHRYAGYPLTSMAASLSGQAWHATTVVRFDGRKGVRRFEEHTGGCPAKLGPVLSYPSADAREMTVMLWRDGEVYTGVFPLSPDGSGRRAVYISPGLKPIELVRGPLGSIIDIESGDHTFGDAVAMAPVESPLSLTATASVPGGAVEGLAAVCGTGQSWEFGRSRYYAGTASGVFSVVCGSDGRRISTRLADSRGIRSSRALAPGCDSVYALLALPGSELSVPAEIGAGGRIRPLAAPDAYTGVAFAPTHSELWVFRADGGADVLCRGYGHGMYSRRDIRCSDTLTACGEPFGISAGGVLCLDSEEAAADVAVGYSDVASRRGREPVALRGAVCDVRAAGASVAVAYEAVDNSGTSPRLYCRMRVSGDIPAPVVCRTAGAPARSIAASVAGRAGTGFRLAGFTLFTDRITLMP